LEGEALQEKSFWCFFLPAKLAKRSTKKDILRACGPRSPCWRVGQQEQEK
jgi:hypothetical protein